MSIPGWGRLPDGATRLLGIVGDPLDHSLSPRLHTAVCADLDRNLIYLPFPVSKDRLPGFFSMAPRMGVVGLNVTTPFKEEAARLAAPADEETRDTGVVNTIRFDPQGPVGCGTDGAGILSWLAEVGLGDEPVGVIGFGATARSLVRRALLDCRPLRAVLTRRPGVVREQIREWAGDGHGIQVSDPRQAEPGSSPGGSNPGGSDRTGSIPEGSDRKGSNPDGSHPPAGRPGVWVSTLPPEAAGLPDTFWERPGRGIMLDMNYGQGRDRMACLARARGWAAADGRGPLCHQAALSMEVWLGRPVEVRLYYEALGTSRRALRPEP